MPVLATITRDDILEGSNDGQYRIDVDDLVDRINLIIEEVNRLQNAWTQLDRATDAIRDDVT